MFLNLTTVYGLSPVVNNRYRQPYNTYQIGFTLVELMVTIAIIAIVASIAIPSFVNTIASNQIKSTSATIQTSINKAKADSVILRRSINWSYDATENSITVADNGTTIANYDLNPNSTLTFNPATITTLVISKDGFIRTNTGGAVDLAIDIGDARTDTSDRRVRVNTRRAIECSGTNC